MTDFEDDAVERLIRKSIEGPTAENGFTDRVMERLPSRRRGGWPKMAGIVAGIGACWPILASAPLLESWWHDWTRGEVSASAIALLLVIACVSLATAWWTLAEGDSR
jgi:hypothetical protein